MADTDSEVPPLAREWAVRFATFEQVRPVAWRLLGDRDRGFRSRTSTWSSTPALRLPSGPGVPSSCPPRGGPRSTINSSAPAMNGSTRAARAWTSATGSRRGWRTGWTVSSCTSRRRSATPPASGTRCATHAFSSTGRGGSRDSRSGPGRPTPKSCAGPSWRRTIRCCAAASYLEQIQLALRRADLVSVQHRVTAVLASYFDILFAVSRVPPGREAAARSRAAAVPAAPRDGGPGGVVTSARWVRPSRAWCLVCMPCSMRLMRCSCPRGCCRYPGLKRADAPQRRRVSRSEPSDMTILNGEHRLPGSVDAWTGGRLPHPIPLGGDAVVLSARGCRARSQEVTGFDGSIEECACGLGGFLMKRRGGCELP